MLKWSKENKDIADTKKASVFDIVAPTRLTINHGSSIELDLNLSFLSDEDISLMSLPEEKCVDNYGIMCLNKDFESEEAIKIRLVNLLSPKPLAELSRFDYTFGKNNVSSIPKGTIIAKLKILKN